jgi:hypothetical protein
MKVLSPLLLLLAVSACAPRAPREGFRVLPARPEYRLRAPDSRETPFPEVLNEFTQTASAWVELRSGMELRIENAYYREGAAARTSADFLGTEVAHYQVRPDGRLRLLFVDSGVKQQPAGQLAVQRLIQPPQQRYRFHRFFYEILLNRRAELRGAVVVGARTAGELNRVSAQLFADPASVCGASLPRCTVFPEKCTVSLEIEITVNGAARTVLWGSFLSSVAPKPRRLELLRLYRGRSTPVAIDASDEAALRLPLLPGDQIRWE